MLGLFISNQKEGEELKERLRKENLIKKHKNDIEKYGALNEYTDKNMFLESSKSLTSGLIRGGIGAFALGPIGALADVMMAKNNIKTTKTPETYYYVAIQFKDDTRSLIEMTQPEYTILLKYLF